MAQLQKVIIRIHDVNGHPVFLDCTQGKEYEAEVVPVGVVDAFGDMTEPCHAPCVQFKDDAGDWVVVAYADKYVDLNSAAPTVGAENNGIPCIIVWLDPTTQDMTVGCEYPGYILTNSVTHYLDGMVRHNFENNHIYVQLKDDAGDYAVRRFKAGRFYLK